MARFIQFPPERSLEPDCKWLFTAGTVFVNGLYGFMSPGSVMSAWMRESGAGQFVWSSLNAIVNTRIEETFDVFSSEMRGLLTDVCESSREFTPPPQYTHTHTLSTQHISATAKLFEMAACLPLLAAGKYASLSSTMANVKMYREKREKRGGQRQRETETDNVINE